MQGIWYRPMQAGACQFSLHEPLWALIVQLGELWSSGVLPSFCLWKSFLPSSWGFPNPGEGRTKEDLQVRQSFLIMSGCWFLHLLPSDARGSLSVDDWARHQLVSVLSSILFLDIQAMFRIRSLLWGQPQVKSDIRWPPTSSAPSLPQNILQAEQIAGFVTGLLSRFLFL